MTKGKEISVDGMVRVTHIPILHYIVEHTATRNGIVHIVDTWD